MNNLSQSFDNYLSTTMEDVIVDGVEIGGEGTPEVNSHLAGPFCYFTKPELHWLELYFIANSFPALTCADEFGSNYAHIANLPHELGLDYRIGTPQARSLIYDKAQKRFIITTNIRSNLRPERFRFVIPPTEMTTPELGIRQKRLNVISYICTEDKIPTNIVWQNSKFSKDRFILGAILLLIESIQHSSNSHLSENVAFTLTTLNGGCIGLASDGNQRRFCDRERWRQVGFLLENILWKYSSAYSRHLSDSTMPSRPI